MLERFSKEQLEECLKCHVFSDVQVKAAKALLQSYSQGKAMAPSLSDRDLHAHRLLGGKIYASVKSVQRPQPQPQPQKRPMKTAPRKTPKAAKTAGTASATKAASRAGFEVDRRDT